MIKSIETYYKGYLCRSRTEARWMVAFDRAGIKYEYEPEGFDLGKAGKRWKTAYLAAETVDIGGGKIKIDSDGAFNFNAVDGSEMKISTSGAELPENSTVGGNKVQQLGATSGTGKRPIEKVKIFVSDGSTSFTDTQLLTGGSEVLTLEFNATVDTEPVFTQANQSFLLANGTEKQAIDSVTLFQF